MLSGPKSQGPASGDYVAGAAGSLAAAPGLCSVSGVLNAIRAPRPISWRQRLAPRPAPGSLLPDTKGLDLHNRSPKPLESDLLQPRARSDHKDGAWPARESPAQPLQGAYQPVPGKIEHLKTRRGTTFERNGLDS